MIRKIKHTIPVPLFLKRIIYSFRWHIIGLFIISVFAAIDFSLRPYLVKRILDTLSDAMKGVVDTHLIWSISQYLFATLFMVVAWRSYDIIRLFLDTRMAQKIIVEMTDYVLQHSHAYYQRNFSGSLVNKIYEVAYNVAPVITLISDQLLRHILSLMGAAFTFSQVDIKFIFIMIGWILITIFMTRKWSTQTNQLSNHYSEVNSRIAGKIVDLFSNVMAIRLFSSRRYEKNNISQWTRESVRIGQALDWTFFRMYLFHDLSFLAAQIFCLVLLVSLYQRGSVTVGDFALVFGINTHISDCLYHLAKDFSSVSEKIGRVSQGLKITMQPLEIVDKKEVLPLKVTKGAIEFSHVTFCYAHPTPLFTDLTVHIKGGEKVGLVGFSGSGKTTFVNLILRLFDIQKGQILIDQQDISQVTQESLRSHIALIPQDPILFHRSIMDNIRYGRLEALDETVIHAAKEAHIHAFVEQLPEGYQTLVGERGVKLSGGQKQRIAIARAILKDAPILLLDEATSALDSVTEALIQNSLLKSMMNKTTLVIAHRLSTLLYMDRILVFHQGNIVEEGTHEALLLQEGLYKRLWNAQVGGLLPHAIKA